ncbi:hypothetical protein Btru_073287 [Bulinus truncatus]|nr:hypothetical protein Btru_073287 [Bulinus truncatus]
MFDDPWLILGDPMVGSSDDEEGWPLQQTARLASSANGKVGLFSTQQGWPLQQAARLASSANSRVGLFSSSKVGLFSKRLDQNSNRFDTDGLWFEEATTYVIMVDVNVSTCVETRAIKVVYTNIKPYGGVYYMGLYHNYNDHHLHGRYVVLSYRWRDERERGTRGSYFADSQGGFYYDADTAVGLQYAFYQDTSDGYQLLYYGSEFSASVTLSFSSTEPYYCSFIVSVIDVYGYRVNCSFTRWINPNYQWPASNTTTLQPESYSMTSIESVLSLNDTTETAKTVAIMSTSFTSKVTNNIVDFDGSVIKDFNATTPAEKIKKFAGLKSVLTSDKKMMTSNSKATNILVDFVGSVIKDFNATTPAEIQIFASLMSVLTSDKKTMTSNSMEIASGSVLHLANNLNRMDAKLSDLAPCLEDVTDVIQNIISYQTIDTDEFYSSTRKKATEMGLSDLETQNFIKDEYQKMKLQTFNKLEQIDRIVSDVTSTWDNLLKIFHKMEDPSGKYNKSKQGYTITTQKSNVDEIREGTDFTSSLGFTFNDVDVGGDLLAPLVVRLTKENGKLVCSCEGGKEVISGVSFNFEPNKIHFGTVFSKFDIQAQGLVFGVFVGLYFIFIVLFFWAHYMDKKGIFQWGVFPLADNFAEDTYFYLITIHTGLRRSAGTKSNVYFCLYGQDDETDVENCLMGLKIVCHFVMACPKYLGELQCLKIWHDNSGEGNEATWYLDRLDIVDLRNGKVCYFICGEWLAAENTLETTIEATGVEDLVTLKSLFISKAKEHLTDDHIWLSLFIRPQNSPFSQVERVGCCFAFLFLAMITSAMFYSGVPDTNRKQPKVEFEVGPLQIASKTRDGSSKKKCQCLSWIAKLDQQLEHLEKILLIKPNTEDLKNAWPQPIRYLAWILILAAVGVSSFFVILYSMEWGQDITEQWLSTFFLAFLQSLFVLDPFKVFVISVFLALLVKKVKSEGLDQLDLTLISQVNKEYGLKKKNCTILNTKLKDCVSSFSSGKEETRDYCLGWKFQPCSEFEKVNKFDEMGGLIPFVSVYPVSVHNPPGLLGSFVQFCQLIGIVLTILGVLYVIFVLGKKKCSAFKDLWFLFDLSAVIIAICAVIMFLLRLSYAKSALNKVYSVLSKSVEVFPSFFFFLFLILLGFIGMGYALFGKTSEYFKDLLTTAESLFTGLLGRSSFRDTNVPLSDRWTTIVYFCLFVGIVVIFLTNYFLAVLMGLIVDKGKNYNKVESTKIFIVLWDSFLQVMGRKRDPTNRFKDKIKEDELEIEDQAENFSKQLEDTKIHHTMLNLETTVYRFLVNNCDNTVMNY